MSNTKRTIRYLLAGFIILSLCVLIAALITNFFPGPPHSTYANYTAPRGEYALDIEYTDAFVFGPHHFFVYGRKLPVRNSPAALDRWPWLPGGKKLLLKFDVYNDGGRIDGACSLRWFTEGSHEIARLTSDGDEQDPESYRIDMTKAMRWN